MNAMKEIYNKIFEENKKITGIAGMITIIIVVAGVFSYEAGAIPTNDALETWNRLFEDLIDSFNSGQNTGTYSFATNGHTNEHSSSEETLLVEHSSVIIISAMLSWNDEDPGTGRTNKPDEFKISLKSPSGLVNESSFQQNSGSGNLQGNVEVTANLDSTADNSGDWIITIEAGDCGDISGPFGFFDYQADTGNDWDLSVKMAFYL